MLKAFGIVLLNGERLYEALRKFVELFQLRSIPNNEELYQRFQYFLDREEGEARLVAFVFNKVQ